ncbi:MAG: DUF4349 domain-containing protein [Actinomycetota bacterium]
MGRTIGNGRSGFRRACALGIITVVAAAACSEDSDDSGSDDIAADTAVVAETEQADAGAPPETDSATVDASTAGSSAPSAPLGVDLGTRDLAVEAGVAFATSNVRDATDDALTTVRANGGLVFSADVRLDDEVVADDGTITVPGSATIVVKVLPEQLDPLIAALDTDVGELLSRTQSSEDVTAQLVDLELRIGVERTALERFEGLLAAATDLDDIVRIQDLINERTVRLEQLLASERALDERVAQSTLTIEISYQPVDAATAVAEPAPEDGLGDALAAGWNAFAVAFFTIAFVLAVLAPFLAVALVLAGLGWAIYVGRRRRGTGSPQQTADDEEPVASH